MVELVRELWNRIVFAGKALGDAVCSMVGVVLETEREVVSVISEVIGATHETKTQAVPMVFLDLLFSVTYMPFVAAVFVILRFLVDDEKTDYKQWPRSFEQFKHLYASKIMYLPPVDEKNKYVIFSDVHMESAIDVKRGIGHFYKNKSLCLSVLKHYAEDRAWTVVFLGDSEEFWCCNDLDDERGVVDKIEPVIEQNRDVYVILSDNFYKNMNPHRFIKIRGNHDDVWKEDAAVSKLAAQGFPGIRVYEFGVIPRNGSEILLMHGHQFDPYNCDANNFFGKFASSLAGETADKMYGLIVSFFNFFHLEVPRIFGVVLAPFFKKNEWYHEQLSLVQSPEMVDDFVFHESIVGILAKRYGCSLIVGHTHGPKVIKKHGIASHFYINSGTSSCWEDCVWTVEVTAEDVILAAWTSESKGSATYQFKLSEATVEF
ncbi:MAG: metallophosphoesterase [Chlorobiales bacterium]|nr:metallophosphoesterase [Chlorobiales bacterium]